MSKISVKLFDYSKECIYSESVDKDSFLFMEWFDTVIKRENIDQDIIDIKYSLSQINKNDKDFNIQSILVVEDDEILCDLYKEMLSGFCHYCEIFQSTDEALSVFLDDPDRFNIILTDNILPESTYSGSEFSKLVLKENKDIKIYIITGEITSVDDDIFDFPVESTIRKPVSGFTIAMTVGKGKRDSKKSQQLEKDSNQCIKDMCDDFFERDILVLEEEDLPTDKKVA